MKKYFLISFYISFWILSICHKTHAADTLKLQSLLSPMVTKEFQELQVPGAIVGVWMNGYEPYITAFGYSDLKSKTPMNITDKMRIGSITKTFVGVVILQLADEGKLSLNDPLSKYFPDFPNGN